MRKGQKMPQSVKKNMIEKFIKIFAYRSKPFYQCDKKGNILVTWKSMGELVRCTPFKRKAVTKVLHEEFKSHKGFRWIYVSQYHSPTEPKIR